jgi:hypothetical protein
LKGKEKDHIFSKINKAPSSGITFTQEGDPMVFTRPHLKADQKFSFDFSVSEASSTKPPPKEPVLPRYGIQHIPKKDDLSIHEQA